MDRTQKRANIWPWKSWLSEDAIKNGQSRDTGNIGHKTQNNDKQNKNTQHINLKR